MERLETSMAELALEKAQMAEEIATLKNQVEHERQNAIHLAEVRHEADLVRVELAQANKEVLLLTHNNAALEGQCVDLSGAKKQLDITVSQLNADLNARITSESEAQTSLINTTRELEATKNRLMLAQDDARRTSESLAIADNAVALMTDNLAARDSTITELRDLRDLTNEQLQTLRGENQTLRDNLAFASDRASSAELMINERELEIFELKTKQAGLQGHITQLVSENTELLAQIEAMKANAERDLTKIAELDSQIEGLNAQVDSLHGELDVIRFDKDQLQARAEADSATAGRFIAQRDATIAERDMQVAKLGADLKSKSQELFERQKQIGQLQVALAESANETKSLRSSQKATEAELATSIKTIEERNGVIADLRAKDQASTKRIGELKTDLAKHKEAIEEHQDVISKLELQLERLRDIEHESLRRRRARIQAEAKRLRDEEADLTRETIDVDQWDEGLSQSRAARASLAPSWGVSPSPE
ncbi:hypothetical protein FRC12_008827 [Ceratobasidium sp. 428]|nr:hypothetical protein FRC12_008827 [Ceratobasidium sp. 428]